MKRQMEPQSKNIDAILTADWHLREDQPTCRTDDFWIAQWKKVKYITSLQEQYNCLVLHAGDFFGGPSHHYHWKPSPRLLSETIQWIPNDFWTVYGNHDLPQHNLDLAYKSGIYTLYQAGKLIILPGVHCDHYPAHDDQLIKGKQVLIWHKMVWHKEKPYPDAPNDSEAIQILKQYPQFDLIVTGDNHQSFTAEYEGRLLVNPGCLTRQTAKDINHQPRVYLWHAETNTVTPEYLPIEQDVITREHIEVKEQRDERIEAFVNRLDGEWETGISFEENMQQFFQTNRVRKSVEQLVYKAMEKED